MSDEKNKKDKGSSVVSLAHRTGTCQFWSLEDMLKEALDEVENGRFHKNSKAILIVLDDSEDKYMTSHKVVKLRYSEMVSLLDVIKASSLRAMGY